MINRCKSEKLTLEMAKSIMRRKKVVCGGHPLVMKLSKYGGSRLYSNREMDLNTKT